MVATNSVTVAVAASANHLPFLVAKFDTGRDRERAAMERVHSVSVGITGQIRRTADAATHEDLMRLQPALEHSRLKRGPPRGLAATWTPIGMTATAVGLL